MLGAETQYVTLAGTFVDLLTAVVIVYHVGWALWVIIRGRGPAVARLILADGVIAALGFAVAGSLLKTIALEDWVHIRAFAFVLVLRTLLKRVFEGERRVAEQRTWGL